MTVRALLRLSLLATTACGPASVSETVDPADIEAPIRQLAANIAAFDHEAIRSGLTPDFEAIVGGISAHFSAVLGLVRF